MPTSTKLAFIRARLNDWADVPDACRSGIVPPSWLSFGKGPGPDGGATMLAPPVVPAIKVGDPTGRVLWSTDELVATANALRVLVGTCEPALARPIGHPDRAWAEAIVGTLVLIWENHPDYAEAVAS
jgi:hypothetical protein